MNERIGRSPVALLMMLGGLVVGISPFLAWIQSAESESPLSYSLSSVPSPGVAGEKTVIELALFVTAAVAIIVPLLPVRRQAGGITVLVVALAGAGVGILESVHFYKAYSDFNNVSLTSGAVGPYIAGIGFVLVIVCSIVYALSGRETTSSHRR